MVSMISNDDIIKLIKIYYGKQVIKIKQLGSCQDFNYQLTTSCNDNDDSTSINDNDDDDDININNNNSVNKNTYSTDNNNNTSLYLFKLSNPLTSSVDQLILQNDVIEYLSKSDLSLIDHIELPAVQRIIIKDNTCDYTDDNGDHNEDDDINGDNVNNGTDIIDDNNCCFNFRGSNINLNDNNKNKYNYNYNDYDNSLDKKKTTMINSINNNTTTLNTTSNIKVQIINNQILKITLIDDNNNDSSSSRSSSSSSSSSSSIFYYARLFVFIKGRDLSSYHYFTKDFLYRFGYFISNVTYILSLYPHHYHHHHHHHHQQDHFHNATTTTTSTTTINHHGIDNNNIISSPHTDTHNHIQTDIHYNDNDMQWDLRICEKTINKFLHDDKIRYNNIYLPETRLHFITNIANKALHELSKYKSLLRTQHIIHGDLALYNIISQQQQHNQSNNDNDDNSSIYNRPSICGIIDFGDLMESWLISDLAISINSVLIHCQSYEEYIPVTLTILQGYYSHRKLYQQQQNDHYSCYNSNHDHNSHHNNDCHQHIDHDHDSNSIPLLEEEIMSLWPLILLRSINNILSNIYELTYSNNNNNIYVIEGIHEDWQTLVNLNRINMYFAQECCRNAVNLKPSIRIAQNNENKSSKYSLLGNIRPSSPSSATGTTSTIVKSKASTSTYMTRTVESVILIDYSPESDVYVDGNWLDETFIDKQHHQYQFHQHDYHDHDHYHHSNYHTSDCYHHPLKDKYNNDNNKIYMTAYGQCNLYLTQTHSLKELPIYNLFVNLYLHEGREFIAPYDGKVQINHIPVDGNHLTFVCTKSIGINIIISGVEVVIVNSHINNNQSMSYKAGEVFAKVVTQKKMKKQSQKKLKAKNKNKNTNEDIMYYTKCSVQISTVIKSSSSSSSSKNNDDNDNNNNDDDNNDDDNNDDDDEICGSRNSTDKSSNSNNNSSSIDYDEVEFNPPRYCTYSMLNYWKVISPSPYELLFGSNVIIPQYHKNHNDIDDDKSNENGDNYKVDEYDKQTSYIIDTANKDNMKSSSSTTINTSPIAIFSLDSSTVDIIHNSNKLITTTTSTTSASTITSSTIDVDDDSLQKRYDYVAKVQEHYFKKPPQMIRGWKEFMYDNHGRAYLDMVNNVTVVGHSHSTIAKVAYKQLQLLNTNSRFNYNAIGIFAKKILDTLPLYCSSSLDCVIFVNSGSEATDLALRIARTVVSERRKKASRDTICLEGAYHGVTTASDEVSTTLNDNPLSRESRPSWIHLVPMPNRFRGRHLQASKRNIDSSMVDVNNGIVSGNSNSYILNTKHVNNNDDGYVHTDSLSVGDNINDSDYDKSVFVDVDDSPDIVNNNNNNNNDDDDINSGNKSINVINNVDYDSDEYMVEYYASYVENLIEKLILQDKKPVAFIAEPLSGNAGGVEIPQGYLLRVFNAIHKIGGLYISDEVQVGYGRLGNVFWGFEEHNIIPDIITMAKAAGNGYPIGYIITNKEIINEFNILEGSFFSSSGGSPCSCIIGHTVLQIINDEQLQHNANIVGNYLHDKLIALSKEFNHIIGYIHGHGLYQGIELIKNRKNNDNTDFNGKEPATKEAYAICERLLELGVICHNTGDYSNVLKIKPPLVFTKESADFFVEALTIALQGW